MRAKTHVAFAAALISLFTVSIPALLMAVVSIMADWDFWLKKVQHRTWSHSLLISLPLLVLAWWTHPIAGYAMLAYVSHPVLDLMNRSPVYLLYPVRTPFRMFKRVAIRVGSIGEEAVFWISLLVLAGSLFWAERGTYRADELTSGILFIDSRPHLASRVRTEYLARLTERDTLNARLARTRAGIEHARAESLRFSEWPRNPSKVDAATREIRKLQGEAATIVSHLDTLDLDALRRGVWLRW